MYRNPKHSLIHSLSGLLLSGKMAPHSEDKSGDFLNVPLEQNKVIAGAVMSRVPPYVNTATEASSPESDFEFIASSTKAKVRELEQEAERLEKAFRTYYQRATQNPSTSPQPAKSPPSVNSVAALRSIASSSMDRPVSAEDRVVSEQPLGDMLKEEMSDMSKAFMGSVVSRPRRTSSSTRLSSTPHPKSRRSLDNEMYLEGKPLCRGLCHRCFRLGQPGEVSSSTGGCSHPAILWSTVLALPCHRIAVEGCEGLVSLARRSVEGAHGPCLAAD